MPGLSTVTYEAAASTTVSATTTSRNGRYGDLEELPARVLQQLGDHPLMPQIDAVRDQPEQRHRPARQEPSDRALRPIARRCERGRQQQEEPERAVQEVAAHLDGRRAGVQRQVAGDHVLADEPVREARDRPSSPPPSPGTSTQAGRRRCWAYQALTTASPMPSANMSNHCGIQPCQLCGQVHRVRGDQQPEQHADGVQPAECQDLRPQLAAGVAPAAGQQRGPQRKRDVENRLDVERPGLRDAVQHRLGDIHLPEGVGSQDVPGAVQLGRPGQHHHGEHEPVQREDAHRAADQEGPHVRCRPAAEVGGHEWAIEQETRDQEEDRDADLTARGEVAEPRRSVREARRRSRCGRPRRAARRSPEAPRRRRSTVGPG